MKKQFSIIAAAMALLMGVTSCSKDNGGTPEPKGEGSIKVTIGFEKVAGGKALSTATPKTSWASNVKDMQLILVQNNVVKVIRPITVPTLDGLISPTFTGIPESGATPYTAYVVANLGQTEGHAMYRNAAVIAESHATPLTFTVGDNFNTKLYALKTQTPWVTGITGEVTGSTGYTSPAEIFIGSASVAIAEGTAATPTIALKRAVSLLRVRLNVSDAAATGVDFTHTDAGIRLRRHGEALNLTTGVAKLATNPVDGVYFSNKAFKNATAFAALAANYEASGVMTDANYSLWNDYLILPGGGSTAANNQFNISIAGFAPEGYLLADGTTVPAGGQLVWWQAGVTQAVAANGILDVSAKITTPGTGGPGIPPATNFGTLDLTVNLTPWGVINGIEIDM